MFSSLTGLLMTGLGTAAAVLAGLWGRHRYRVLKEDRDRIRATQDAIDQAAQRLEAARKTPVRPIDARRRTDFEQRP